MKIAKSKKVNFTGGAKNLCEEKLHDTNRNKLLSKMHRRNWTYASFTLSYEDDGGANFFSWLCGSI